MIKHKHSSKKISKTPLLAASVAVALLAIVSVVYLPIQRWATPSEVKARDAAKATPVAESEEEEEEEEEMVAFEFPAEGPIKTYHMEHGHEAIITMYWPKKTWAHIERFTSIVYPNEATVLELEDPEPGLYPLTLDSGEIRGYVQVD